MDEALVTKGIVCYSKEEQGNAVFAIHYMYGKSRLTSYTLLTRQSASVLTVGMPYGLRSL